MDDDDDEGPTCPLCLEELDATDRAVKACQCGYQVCLWCLHHIREQLNGKCPACRTPYEEENFKFSEVNPEMAAKEAKDRATAKKERERREKVREIERERARSLAVSQQKAKHNLKHARIVQRNLVYVIGLSLTLAREEVLRRGDMFGKFGRMLRILINRAHPYNADAPGGPSISAYIQYARDSDASAAVRAMNTAVFDGREIRCAIATTKYCDSFVKSGAGENDLVQHCGNPECMYYHEICQTESILTREDVLARQLGPPPPSHLFLTDQRRAAQAQNARAARASAAMQRSGTSSATSSGAPTPSSATVNGASHRSIVPPPSLQTSSRRIVMPPLSASQPGSPEGRLGGGGSSLARSPGGNTIGPGPPPSASAPQLPSTAGWASSQQSRGSPPRPGGLALNDATRALARAQLTPRGNAGTRPTAGADRVAPPGFEGVPSAVPARPPGFEAPLSRPLGSMSNITPPPGFGGMSSSKSATLKPIPLSQALPAPPSATPVEPQVDSPLSAVAMAWSQEASADQVVPSSDRRGPLRSTGGRAGGSPARIAPDDAEARSELAEVLAKIGGDLGVSSEFQALQQPGSAVDRSQLATAAPGRQAPLDSLFGNHSLRSRDALLQHGRGEGMTRLGFPSGSIHATGHTPVPSMASPSSRFGDGLPLGSPGSITVEAKPKRNNSRFGFAREDAGLGASSYVNVRSPPSGLVSTPTSAAAVPARMPASVSVRPEQGAPEPGRVPFSRFDRGATHRSSSATPRQPRSRFDFADRAPSPPRNHAPVAVASGDGGRGVGGLSKNPADAEPTSETMSASFENLGGSFAQLSTADKLASIFNSAQYSTDTLPPMPSVAPRPTAPVDVTRQEYRTNLFSSGSRFAHGAGRGPQSGSTRHVMTPPNNPSTAIAAASSIPSTPPGFREATSGTPPETTVDDASSSPPTGVACASVGSGGHETSSLNGEDIVSSEAESFEEDRKRSRAQRKRDKKARQRREAAERRTAHEAVAMSRTASVGLSGVGEGVANPKEGILPPSLPSQVRHSDTYEQTMELPDKRNDGLSSDSSRNVADDPGRFMSVSELEREVEAARAREAQLQNRLLELQRRIRSYTS